MRRKKKKSSDHSVPHVDEKWLVSYSDMMTLLFGLFVMLYSFALKNKGQVEGIQNDLKQIAEKGFNASAVEEKLQDVDSQTLKKVIQGLQSQIVKLNEQVAASKNDAGASTIEESRLKDELEKLKAQNAEQVKKLERLPASQVNLADSKKINSSSDNGAVLVYVRWTNRNHDIDLVVKTPDGQDLGFKKRKASDTDTDEFLVDSKNGPGLEMFKSLKPKSGSYQFEVSLYNSRGDTKPTEVTLFAVVKGEEKLLETFILKDDDAERAKVIPLDLQKLVP